MEDRSEDKMNSNFTEDEMIKCCKTLKNNKAPGPDGIRYELIKEGMKIPKFRMLTLRIFNQILESGIKPEEWSLGSIISLYKGKGDIYDVKSQRGITLTDTLLKFFEKLINF